MPTIQSNSALLGRSCSLSSPLSLDGWIKNLKRRREERPTRESLKI